MTELIPKLKTDIIAIGRVLWDKDLASGLNGNISVRVDGEVMLLTATQTCLGLLKDNQIILMKTDGTLLEEGKVSTEKLLHTEIYKNFPEVTAVVHSHTTFTNAYFTVHDEFTPATYEARFYVGQVQGIPQATPSVTEAEPVMAALRKNSIVVLKNHGVVAMGKSLFDCFLLIQQLEESIKVDAISRLYSQTQVTSHKSPSSSQSPGMNTLFSSLNNGKKYKLFSPEQIEQIVKLVNADAQLKEMGEKTKMTMDLAVQLNETGQTFSFNFQNGRIANVGQDSNAEFLITAPENIWRAVFNREIDPFVATTQKKMNLRGDFAKISKWYAPCSRIFEIWSQVPVE